MADPSRDYRFRAAFDTGGTFTDLVLVDNESGDFYIGKVLSTPKDPSVAIIQGLGELIRGVRTGGGGPFMIYGATTHATNAVVERKGARTGLITTKGFKDVVVIGREWRYDLYNLQIDIPQPLVPDELRLEVDERIAEDGEVVRPLDEDQAKRVIDRLRSEGVEAVAVSFLHSFRVPDHERRVGALVARELPGVAHSLSSEVAPEIREYERTITTIVNAYIQPIMRTPLRELR